MSAKTKIVVLRMRELIYTGIFVGLAILLVVIFLAMFRENRSDQDTGMTHEHSSHSDSNAATDADAAVSPASYIPGVYTASLPLRSQSLDVEVIVTADQISSIRLLNLEEDVAAMYPLMEPTLTSLRDQILTNQSIDGITYEENAKYTAYVLLQAVQNALKKAAVTEQ